MEAQIKEEAHEASLVCLDTSADSNLASLSLVEKYSRYHQDENSDIDSDCDFFPDDTMLREEYAQLVSGASRYPQTRNLRLSAGLPSRFRLSLDTHSESEKTDKLTDGGDSNGTLPHADKTLTNEPQPTHDRSRVEHETDNNVQQKQPTKSDLNRYNELLERLAEVRRCGDDGNSIFCTQEELDTIRGRYGDILDFIERKSLSFERRSSSKDSENEEQVDVGNAAPEEQRESMKLLAERIVSVQQARDRFYEIEQQVREQVEQLELVERYKMESVG